MNRSIWHYVIYGCEELCAPWDEFQKSNMDYSLYNIKSLIETKVDRDIKSLESVLLDASGKASINGSEKDLKIIQEAMDSLKDLFKK